MAITLAEYQLRLNDLVNIASDEIVDRAIVPAANNLLADIKDRIGLDGKDSKGNKMKGYSNDPAYFRKDDFVKKGAFKGRGNPNKIKNIKGERRSMFFNDGYKGLRDIQGMDTQVKNLIYSGDMMLDYVMGKSDGEIQLGFKTKSESEKRKWNEAREKTDIFKATDEEIRTYNEEFKKAYRQIITKNLR